MAIIRQKLSASTNGQAISIAAVATPGTTIHTGTTATSASDEVHIWFTNTTTNPVTLTYEHGTTNVNSNIIRTIPGQAGLELIAPGLFLASGLVASAFASTASALKAHGFINRLTTGA